MTIYKWYTFLSSMIFAIIFSSGIFSVGYIKNLNAENSEFETRHVMPKVNLTNYDLNTVKYYNV